MNIEELKKEYAKQDNRSTAYPIYVQVQERHCVGVMKDGYSVVCPFGDDETKQEFRHPEIEGTFESYNDAAEAVSSYFDDLNVAEKEFENIEELTMGYIWVPVEFFLTIKGAEEYMRTNAHNHSELRTYVGHFERRNFEMNDLLNELGFRVK